MRCWWPRTPTASPWCAGRPLVAGAYILGPPGAALSADAAAFFRDADPFGFILFDRNIETPDQTRALISDLRTAVGRDAPVLIDQEGGRVQRMWHPHWREWPAALDHATAAGADAERVMYLRYRIIAEELRDIGIDVNCAPLGDVAGPTTHPFLRNRCYGESADTVAALARRVADGLLDGGVLPVMKHMPGHGRGTVNSHHDLPVTDASAEDLFARDFAPFQALADLPMGMTAHYVFSAFDDRPATVSPVMIELIRVELGFDGLLMTDDLSMEALGGGIGDRAGAAIAAGCDLALHCNGEMADMQAVVAAVGPMSDASAVRAARALGRRGAVEPIDIAAAGAELEALTPGMTG